MDLSKEYKRQALEAMKKIMMVGYDTTDRQWLIKHTKELAKLELPQTFPAYENAAKYVHNLMLDNGIDSEYLTFPADGKTVYQDKCMPIAWDASVGKLTVLSGANSLEDPVVADYERMPLHLIKHSVSTPKGGIVTRLVTEASVYAGEDCTGAMVLLEAVSRPTAATISPLLDLGALGVVSDYLVGAVDTPDELYWANAATDGNSWHVIAEHRDFIGFMITPRTGRTLRQAVNTGAVTVRVECDGRRYEGELPAVTGLVPGKQKREVWLLAHLYEPFEIDNAIGIVSVIYAVKRVRELIEEGVLPPLQFSLRLVFAMEHYGFAAVADRFGGDLHDRAWGAFNSDAIFGAKMHKVSVFYASLFTPFFGNFTTQLMTTLYNETFDGPLLEDVYPSFHDDMILGDTTTGLPTVWPAGEHENTHHNTIWNNNFLDEENFARAMGYFIAWIGSNATLNEETLPTYLLGCAQLAQELLNKEAERETVWGTPEEKMEYLTEAVKDSLRNFKMAVDMPVIDQVADSIVTPKGKAKPNQEKSIWLEYADQIIPSRTQIGLPYDMMRVPKDQQIDIPGKIIYGATSFILAAMDGKKTLKRAILESTWQRDFEFTDKDIKKCVLSVTHLADWGYLSLEEKAPIGKELIKASLKDLGIEKGDVLLVHSGLSHLGHIQGGADTIIDALVETVGEEGTILMPCFTRPYIGFEGTVSKDRRFRPFHADGTDNPVNIWTGAVPKALLKRKGVVRSANASHSWGAIGKYAAECVADHGLLDAPAGKNSPMAKALELKGKILFFGCGVASNTFLHYLEDQANAPFLGNAIVKVMDADGELHTEVMKNHLPGHRSFYGSAPEQGKFYQEAFKRGLEVKETALGLGKLRMMDMQQLYKIGMDMFAEDPLATLCDDPDCFFCRKYRK